VGARALDIAAYIVRRLKNQKPLCAWKIHLLLFYCQAWNLVWEETPLFDEQIFAWEEGCVIKSFYDRYSSVFYLSTIKSGKPRKISKKQKENIYNVLKFYGAKTSQFLTDMMRGEAPWKNARASLSPGDLREIEVSLASIYEFYSSIAEKDPRKIRETIET
jgi:uncharacterized phage-associated protein